MPWPIQIIVIGFVIGFIANLLSPGPNKPAGFLLTTGLGIAGAFVATRIGRAIGWLESNELAGVVEMILGAVIVTFVWNRLVADRAVRPSSPTNRAPPHVAAQRD